MRPILLLPAGTTLHRQFLKIRMRLCASHDGQISSRLGSDLIAKTLPCGF
ncbi:MAG: hypothetical protein MUO25_11785 [Thermoanaerobaculaceae bacterium]|nr:hypothetical protein [Thermoanaerobaculaceae bacterium]